MSSPYTANQIVTTYTGESGIVRDSSDTGVPGSGGITLYGYEKADGSAFIVNGHYTGGETLYYDGHPGIDFRTKDQAANGQINVLAAASGTARWVAGSAFNTIYIDHGNGYTTHYLHLSQRIAADGLSVTAGQVIGVSGEAGAPGAPHLHFEVKLNGVEVDPYGWEGAGADPYTRATNVRLWEGALPTPTVVRPTIAPNGGSFTSSIQVTLACATSGATIRYTTNGSDPTATSSIYSGPFTLTSSATVKARGFKSGSNDSGVASAAFTAVTPDYPSATWVAAATGNYEAGSRGSSAVRWIILHTTEGSAASTIALFQNPASEVSAHYMIARTGEVTQFVLERDVAYTAGNYPYNLASINIEIERSGTETPTTAQYSATADLVKSIQQRFNVPASFPTGIAPASPANGSGIIGHIHVPDPFNPALGGGASHHTDPVNWNWPVFQSYFGILPTYAVTPNAGANGSINPNTAQTVNSGGNVPFTATPISGYVVDQWLANGSPVQTGGNAYTLANVTANATVQVTFKLAPVTSFAVTPSAGANGAISPNTVQTVNSGGSVPFTATPANGYVVDQWLANGSPVQTGGNAYTLANVTANATVQVTFKLAPVTSFAVTPSAGANGAISPNTVQTVNSGGSVPFTATPANGYVVDQWLANGSPAQTGGNAYTLTNVTANATVQVTFKSGVTTTGSATRTLPSYGYVPGSALTVSIAVNPVATVANFAVEDVPPAGWAVSNISQGGSLDAVNGKVKWGPFFDNTARTLAYQVTPPSGETGTKTFAGSASFDGQSVVILGNNSIDKLTIQYHPCDANIDLRVVINELTAYGSAWKAGSLWQGIPIDVNYVTRAGYLWKNGEAYHYDSTQAAPLWWQTGAAAAAQAFRTQVASTPASVPSATRSLPPSYSAGSPANVAITASPVAGTSAYAVEEAPPVGWTVSNIDNSGVWDSVNGKVKWGPFFDNTPRTLGYRATPPAGTTGAQNFAGTASFDGTGVPVGGSDQITNGSPIIDFTLYKGTYKGVLVSNAFSNATTGRISAVVGANGSLSGTFVLGGKTYGIRGVLSPVGSFSVSIPSTQWILEVQLDPNNLDGEMTGSIKSNDGELAAFNAERTPVTFTAIHPTPFKGAYTVNLPADPQHPETTYPQGTGYGTITVTAASQVRFVGVLGDQTPVSFGAVALADGRFPVYFPLYLAKGSLAGWLTLQDPSEVNQVEGTLDWFKPVTNKFTLYPAAISGTIAVEGSGYIAPPKQPQILPTGPATFTVTGGNVSVIDSLKNLTIDAKNKIKIVGNEKFTMTLAPASGLFTGTFYDTAAKLRTFNGAILQNRATGAGLFRGNGQTGTVEILTPP
jgi:hypothetical protein